MTNKARIKIPHDWKPRDYQLALWKALEKEGYKKAIYVWHRRAGKDLFAFNYCIYKAVETVGTYWHVFPQLTQGRKAIWEETTLDGKRYIDHIPKELIHSVNNQEMMIRLKNDSVYRIVGSEDFDKLRGSGIKGVIYSEYAEQNPKARLTINPMILASQGWELLNFTPKGKNHAYDLFKYAEDSERWFSQVLTVDDTNLFTEDQLDEARDELLAQGYDDDFFQQEYYCSFDGQITGAYYGKLLTEAEKDKRITSVKYDISLEVHTAWDLGVSDATSIWFFQTIGNEIRLIDYYENSGEGLDFYIKMLKEKDYNYGSHIAPHDIDVREFTTGKSRLEFAQSLGINFHICPKLQIQDGINAVRQIFNRCWFDKENCKNGIAALNSYRKEWDDKRQCFKSRPLHDWTSHCADAFRYLAVGLDQIETQNGFNNFDIKLDDTFFEAPV